MEKHSIPPKHLVITFSVLIACVLSACPSGEEPVPGEGCDYNGKSYQVGEGFPSADGCNSCSCTNDGQVACTLVACPPVKSCTFKGTKFPVGATFPAGDGCDFCSCTKDGQVVCTHSACAPRDSCTYDGKKYPVDASFPSSDGCNTCQCTAYGVTCTDRVCPIPNNTCVRGGCSGELCVEGSAESGDEAARRPISTCQWREEYACYAKAKCERQPNGQCGHTPSKELSACLQGTGGGCAYNSQWRQVGETFPSADGCNTCTCGVGGAVGCTKRACPPAPKPCLRTGCSGEICAEQETVSACFFRPVYACYQAAACTRQENGQCGFTPTLQLAQCVASYGGCQSGGTEPFDADRAVSRPPPCL